jgi:hypothetical protein
LLPALFGKARYKMYQKNIFQTCKQACYHRPRTLGSSRLPGSPGKICINMIGPQAMEQMVEELDETI